MTRGKNGKKSLKILLDEALAISEDQPYEVPSNWLYFYCTSLIDIQGGTQPPKSNFIDKMQEGYIRLVQIRDFSSDKYKVYVPIKKNLRVFNKEDILIARYGASIGKICTGLEGVYNVALAKTTFSETVLNRRYVYWLLNSQHFQVPLMSISRTAQAGFNKDDLAEFKLPLPPLPEQQRIVDGIESLFEKLDAAKELAQNALDSFENRKATILHKAFTGELTAKWRDDNKEKIDSIKERMDIIRSERLALDKCGKEIESYLEEIDDQHEDDKSWLKLKAMAICDNITCGKTPTGNITEDGEVPFLKVYNIVNNSINFEYKPQFIGIDIHEGKLRSSMLIPGDVVMNIVGPPLRKIAIIPDDYPRWNINQAIVRFRTIMYVNNRYLYYCLLNRKTLDEVIEETKGVVGQANISVTQSRNLEIPIPSKLEQEEIVRILDNVFVHEQQAQDLCNIIEQVELMKKAILARAFRGELGTNNPEEESAIELLKEVLAEKLK